WVTVGFFEVNQETVTSIPANAAPGNGVQVRQVSLGQEIGRADNRNVRHRMFAIVDRSNFLPVASTASTNPQAVAAGAAVITPAAMTGTSADGTTWRIGVGTVLTVDSGVNQETVTVTAVTATTFTATFAKAHAVGFPIVAAGNANTQPIF